MADIPSNEQRIQIEETDFQSPNSEILFQRIGGSINFLLDKTSATKIGYFPGSGTSNIVSSFIVPGDAQLIYYWLLGGGGGGGGTDGQLRGAQGGGGAFYNTGVLPVIGGSTLSVTVGGGGIKGFGNEDGKSGGNTTVTGGGLSLLAQGVRGGQRALTGGNGITTFTATQAFGGFGGTEGNNGDGGRASEGANASSGGVRSGSVPGGGGGGASPVASGGNGGNANSHGFDANGFGAGGGGSGGDNVAGFLNGGNGGPGLAVLITYSIG